MLGLSLLFFYFDKNEVNLLRIQDGVRGPLGSSAGTGALYLL